MVLTVVPLIIHHQEIAMEQERLIIGSRGSKLALWQANFVQAELKKIGVAAEIKVIKTKGDQIQNLSFDKIEGKGFFTKEIEDALLAEDIDLAVHSMKDMPTTPTPGLTLAGVSYREDPEDWLLIRKNGIDQIPLKIKKSATVGTSSSRRKAMLKDLRPDLKVVDLRGNVPTRIEKLRSGNYDGIILAAAGIKRLDLNLNDLEVVPLNKKEFVPAPAQGVLAFQSRTDDLTIRRIVQKLHHSEVSTCTNVERKVLRMMDGGCQMPLGVFCEQDQMGNFHVYAAMSKNTNESLSRVKVSSSTSFGLAESVFEKLK